MSDFVVCISNEGYLDITLGKVYEVLDFGNGWCDIVNDAGNREGYHYECFKGITQKEGVKSVKPPLSLQPRKIYWEHLNHHRRQDIIAAMQRRMEAKMDIPVEWCKELIDLVIAGDRHE